MIAANRRPSGRRLADVVALIYIGSCARGVCCQAGVVNVHAISNKRVSRANDVDAGCAHQSRTAQIDGSAGISRDGGIIRCDIAAAIAGRDVVHLAVTKWLWCCLGFTLAIGGAANQNRCSD
jgi:hypothetical protein